MQQSITFRSEDIEHMERYYRANYINSLGGFKSLALVGTRSPDGAENLALFNSFFHLGAHPPLLGCIVRPETVQRQTLEYMQSSGYYTVNHVHAGILQAAHQCSAPYPAGESEFTATGLQSVYEPEIPAPFVAESQVQYGVKFIRKELIPENGTLLVIGEIIFIRIPEESLGQDGHIDLELAGTLTCSGLDTYHRTQKIVRLPRAKV